MMKKFFALVLAFCMMLTLPTYAANKPEEYSASWIPAPLSL